MNTLNTLYIQTLTNNGNTVNSSLSTPKRGYMVAKSSEQPALLHKQGLTRYQFKKAVKRLTKKGNDCAGFWLNPDDKKWYIEGSEHFARKREALSAGKKRKQIAIFNLSNFEEILL